MATRNIVPRASGEGGIGTTSKVWGSGIFKYVRIGDGSDTYLKIPILTTTQRNALTPETGMVIYNSTNTRLEIYKNSGWNAIDDNYGVIEFIIDGGGSTITTGQKGHLEIPFKCEIQSIILLADQSGSIVIDIWKDTYANFPPTDADSITASAPPTITTAQKTQDSTLTGWTKTITAGDILAFNVDSVTTIQRVVLSLYIKKTY